MHTGNRSAVTGGKQLDGFITLLRQVAIDIGVPAHCIYIKGNHIPGYFRPTKDWDKNEWWITSLSNPNYKKA